jgi:hypothetical protein
MRRANAKASLAAAALCGTLLYPAFARVSAQGAPIQVLVHDRGQGIAPIYEGWFEAPDGTIRVSYGYLNLNSKEELDIPVGPNNHIDPGPADQGQPTHFDAKRKTGVFTVTLPKGSRQEVTWTLSANGTTYSIPSNLGQAYVISPLKGTGPPDLTAPTSPRTNLTPFARFSEDGPAGQGPSGIATSVNAMVGIPLPVTLWITDDGVPRKRPGAKGRFSQGLTVDWSKYRGAGMVSFSNVSPPVDGDKAVTQVTFSTAGEYMLIARVDDHGGQGQCCWTNAYLKASVK